MRENVTIGTDSSQLARDLLASFRPELRDRLGSEDSFKQVARRIKRRMRQEQTLEEVFGNRDDEVNVLDTWTTELLKVEDVRTHDCTIF